MPLDVRKACNVCSGADIAGCVLGGGCGVLASFGLGIWGSANLTNPNPTLANDILVALLLGLYSMIFTVPVGALWGVIGGLIWHIVRREE